MPLRTLPREVASLVQRHLVSMDHVAVILAMREAPDRWFDSAAIAVYCRVEPRVANRVLADLFAADLIVQAGSSYQFHATPDSLEALDQLSLLYRNKPVTLVRAVYGRLKDGA